MDLHDTAALCLLLFLATQAVAIPLGAALGVRVSGFRWFLIVASLVYLGWYFAQVLQGVN